LASAGAVSASDWLSETVEIARLQSVCGKGDDAVARQVGAKHGPLIGGLAQLQGLCRIDP